MRLEINKVGMAEGIEVRPTPNKGGEITPTLIVVHDTAGDISNDSSIDWLCRPGGNASAHFVIGRDGKITQLASCNVKTWHAGRSFYKSTQFCNNFSVGIEHVNPGKMLAGGRSAWGKVYDPEEFDIQRIATPHHGDGHWMPYTEPQLSASFELCLAIKQRYDIDDIAPHWEISPGRKVDTNPLFPLASFRGRMEGRQDAEMLVQSKPGAVFRKWPSFNPGNRVIGLDDDGWFKPVKAGVYEISGVVDEMPAEILSTSEPQLWYQVVLEAKEKEPVNVWVWSGHVKEPRA